MAAIATASNKVAVTCRPVACILSSFYFKIDLTFVGYHGSASICQLEHMCCKTEAVSTADFYVIFMLHLFCKTSMSESYKLTCATSTRKLN